MAAACLPVICKTSTRISTTRAFGFSAIGIKLYVQRELTPNWGGYPSLWDKEKIINELRRMQKQNLPLYAKYVMKNHSKLFHGALAAYGSWNKALIAAGIITIPRKTRLGLLRELRDAVESRSEISQELRAEIAYYFGTLRHAKIALKTDAKLLSGWSKRKIITVLAQKHRSKEKLNYGPYDVTFPPW
jgi:hypothetical protein